MTERPIFSIPHSYFERFSEEANAVQHFLANLPETDAPPTIDDVNQSFVDYALEHRRGFTTPWETPLSSDPTCVPGCTYITAYDKYFPFSSSSEGFTSFCLALALQSTGLREAACVGALFPLEAYYMKYDFRGNDPDGVRVHHDAEQRIYRARVAALIFCVGASDLVGGDTVFPVTGTTAAHRQGSVTGFWNYRRDGTLNEGARHMTTPVTSGLKETLLVFFRCASKSFLPPTLKRTR